MSLEPFTTLGNETMRPQRDQSGIDAAFALAAGLIGGFVAWVIVERSGWFTPVLYGSGSLAPGTLRLHLQVALGAVYGLCIGLALSGCRWPAAAVAGRLPAVRGTLAILAGGALGAMAGAFGLWAGQGAYDHLLNLGSASDIISLSLAARCAGWGAVGLFLGVSQGILRGSARRIALGALGGVCGGIFGGAVLEASKLLGASASFARLIGFVFVGAASGFFIEAAPALIFRRQSINERVASEQAMNNPSNPSAQLARPSGESATQSSQSNPAKGRPAAQLIGLQGAYAGMIFPLVNNKSHLVVGRLPDCDVCLMNDRGISRRHALIRRDPESGEYRLEDLRSANGTCINHKRLRPNRAQTLYVGDVVDFGASSLRFEWIGAPRGGYVSTNSTGASISG